MESSTARWLAEPRTVRYVAERVGFEPTCPLLAGKTLSRRPRYDRFGTSPQKSNSPKSKVEESWIGG